MVHHLLNYINSLVKSVFYIKKKTEKKLHIYWLTKSITQAIDLSKNSFKLHEIFTNCTDTYGLLNLWFFLLFLALSFYF